MAKSPTVYKNRVLAALPKSEIARLATHLQHVTLKLRQPLLHGRSNYAYFLESGLASVVLPASRTASVEVGVVGCDGVVGIPALLGAQSMPGKTYMQIAGDGYRVQAARLKDEFERQGELRRYLQHYLFAYFVQASQNAVCNRLHTITERLAKWLLTCQDRVGSREFLLTHEFMATMLGTTRTTVTIAAKQLQRAGLIDYSRGKVVIQRTRQLEATSCECYRIVSREFGRLGLWPGRV